MNTNILDGRRKVLLLFLFLFLFSIAGVQAISPFKTDAEYGFDLRLGVHSEVNQYDTYDFHIHVFNSSNGVPITDGVSCYLHLYNPDGTHEFEGYDNTVSHDFDYSFDIDGGNFTVLGEYIFIAQCNNTESGGGAGGSVYVVNHEGKFTGSDDLGLIIIIVVVAVCLIGFGMWKEDATMTLLGSFVLYFLGIYILFSGIAGVKDPVTTWGIGLITLGVAFYISTRAGIEIVNGG